jgi:hypothetical protein
MFSNLFSNCVEGLGPITYLIIKISTAFSDTLLTGLDIRPSQKTQ